MFKIITSTDLETIYYLIFILHLSELIEYNISSAHKKHKIFNMSLFYFENNNIQLMLRINDNSIY